MQKKTVICVIGIVLLFLTAARAGRREAQREETETKPLVTTLQNVYITEATEEMLTLFDGSFHSYPLGEEWKSQSEEGMASGLCGQVADVTLTDQQVTGVSTGDRKRLTGKVLAVEQGKGVTLEEYGQLPFAEEVVCYVLYEGLRIGRLEELRIGYSFADFVIRDGEICAVLLARTEEMDAIRVLIRGSDYGAETHTELTVSCDTDYAVRYVAGAAYQDTVSGNAAAVVQTEKVYGAGEQLCFTPQDPGFADTDGRILIVPLALTGRLTLPDLKRAQGAPSYRGILELQKTEAGIVVINEVLLEDYLCGVVPSEMPASYPAEALKAQAICARTYAYAHMQNPGIPRYGAHVDDSTAYQVYNNIAEQAAATAAVKETAGLLVTYEGALADTFYYSTSCGFGTDERVWNPDAAPSDYLAAQSVSKAALEGESLSYTAQGLQDEETFRTFLSTPPASDFEREEPWYRWSYRVQDIDQDRMLSVLQSRYRISGEKILQKEGDSFVSKPVEKLGDILQIRIQRRNEGGVAEALLIEGSEAAYLVLTELNIRYVLCDGSTRVERQDGSLVDMSSLLPSAFCIISTVQEGENVVGYEVSGGGFGHGVGMSQNGAKCMAQAGCFAEQILTFFYRGSVVCRVGET